MKTVSQFTEDQFLPLILIGLTFLIHRLLKSFLHYDSMDCATFTNWNACSVKNELQTEVLERTYLKCKTFDKNRLKQLSVYIIWLQHLLRTLFEHCAPQTTLAWIKKEGLEFGSGLTSTPSPCQNRLRCLLNQHPLHRSSSDVDVRVWFPSWRACTHVSKEISKWSNPLQHYTEIKFLSLSHSPF